MQRWRASRPSQRGDIKQHGNAKEKSIKHRLESHFSSLQFCFTFASIYEYRVQAEMEIVRMFPYIVSQNILMLTQNAVGKESEVSILTATAMNDFI